MKENSMILMNIWALGTMLIEDNVFKVLSLIMVFFWVWVFLRGDLNGR